jgi:putative redox protein
MTQITATLSTGTEVELSNGRHTWKADEPVDLGGADAGPNPYELLLGSLGACTCITLAMYCRRKGIALESVTASYEFDRIHAKDCEDCDDQAKGFIDHITSHVHITGDLDDAQKRRLAEISHRCPVHKTLAKAVSFSDNASFG